MIPQIEEREEQHCSKNHVRLQLYTVPDSDTTVYLEIPLEVIKPLCFHPRKYLHYIAWAVLGVDGHISESDDGEAIDNVGDLADGATYHYVHDGLKHKRIVDLEAIKTRSIHSSSIVSETRDPFTAGLVQRDVACMFTGAGPLISQGLHLIPHARGAKWLQMIIANRPRGENDDDVSNMDDINDRRNGILASPNVHAAHGTFLYVFLKTPNHVLMTNDIPQRERTEPENPNTKFPPNLRVTAQWLVRPGMDPTQLLLPNNTDGKTGKNTKNKSLPAGLILHYLYGASVLKLWGKNTQHISQFVTPRPPKPVPAAPMGPKKKVGNRSSAKNRCDEGRKQAEQAQLDREAGGSVEAAQNLENVDEPDALDMVMFFWGNNPAAIQRHQEEESRMELSIREWAQDVHTGF